MWENLHQHSNCVYCFSQEAEIKRKVVNQNCIYGHILPYDVSLHSLLERINDKKLYMVLMLLCIIL